MNIGTDFFAQTIPDVLRELSATVEGLQGIEPTRRLQQNGYNELPREQRISVLRLFLNQFANALILLLIAAGLLSVFLGERTESIAIFAIVLINAVLGFIQEFKAERAIEALEKISAPHARVLRNGKAERIPARYVVPGDILLLEEGDIVPADARMVSVNSLQIEEASLTGESVPSKKVTHPFKIGTSVADQENMAFMGTVVTYGKGSAVVTATGAHTELGKIAKSIQSSPEVKTPLQMKFHQLAVQIGVIAVLLIAIVLVSGTVQQDLGFSKMLLFALVLAVATIPSALPVIVTVSLSLGANRLAKQNMLIKKLPAAESLGAVTVICSDKTGTITKNQMTVTDFYADGAHITVSGAGYEPSGDFFQKGQPYAPQQVELLLRTAVLCNNAKLIARGNQYSIAGDPTEGSLIVLAKKGQIDETVLARHFRRIEELPFDSDRKRMTVIVENMRLRRREAYVKGAPDLLIDQCTHISEGGKTRPLTHADREHILAANHSFGQRALRVLGLAYRELTSTATTPEQVEKNLTFIGLVGMIDPPRDEVQLAVEECAQAGIRAMIITGDHAVTTRAIAEQIGLMKAGDLVLTGADLDAMSDAELVAKIDQVRIIARALPIQKSRVVDALKQRGHVVAMTGDGVNDAPALKKADIGVAMGITGTDVSKEVAKAILVDDNFATIVHAVREGRNIYEKMIKSAKYLLSCNAGEIGTVLFAILLNLPLPVLPLQVLLINLLTDTAPAVGLGFESSDEGIMERPPRNPNEKPISRPMFISIVVFGIIMSLGTLSVFHRLLTQGLVVAQTAAFTALVLFQMFAVLSSRTLRPTLHKLNPFTNLWLLGGIVLAIGIQCLVIYVPILQNIFGTAPLSLAHWIEISIVASLGFIMMEASKFLLAKVDQRPLRSAFRAYAPARASS